MRKIKIFDTTLRDGEQMVGVGMNIADKVRVAGVLAKLRVDFIEAGFPASSVNDRKAVEHISQLVDGCTVVALARANREDIRIAAEALSKAARKRIHIFIATSDLHLEYKLRISRQECLERIRDSVSYACSLVDEVQFAAEDASRSDPEFLCLAYQTAVDAGACCINVPDTVGYSTPGEFGGLIAMLSERVRKDGKPVEIGVHCHNDLGLAVANTLAAIENGATQADCTVNGIGERAGNTALEELVMALKVRSSVYGCDTNVDTTMLSKASKTVSAVSGIYVPLNKAIVGKNAFSHESGIHQHGVLANRNTYEIMSPQMVGIRESSIVLGRLSGHHAFEEKLAELDLHPESAVVEAAFARFKDLACRKKDVSDEDIRALVEEAVMDSHIEDGYELDTFQTQSGNRVKAMALVSLSRRGNTFSEAATGEGPIDSSFNAINRIVGKEFKLVNYSIKALTGGTDALGEVRVRISDGEQEYLGKGVSTDIIASSIKAYVNAINRALFAGI